MWLLVNLYTYTYKYTTPYFTVLLSTQNHIKPAFYLFQTKLPSMSLIIRYHPVCPWSKEKLLNAEVARRPCRKDSNNSNRPETTHKCEFCGRDCFSHIGLYSHKQRCNNRTERTTRISNLIDRGHMPMKSIESLKSCSKGKDNDNKPEEAGKRMCLWLCRLSAVDCSWQEAKQVKCLQLTEAGSKQNRSSACSWL